MKLWMKKIAVILIAILTLGTYIPPIGLNTEAEDSKNTADVREGSLFVATDEKEFVVEEIADPTEEFLTELTKKAKEQTITKLGPRIMNEVEDDLFTTILPHMDTIIEKVVRESDENAIPYYEITEDPSKGIGERIFNVYDHQTNNNLIKFHVRRDNRPLEGYWFNFHYHVNADNFEEHHHIGDIYWDKNIPPKWMS